MQQSNGLPLVFLDTNVVLAYLRGESPSSDLFSQELADKIRLAINPIVLQELFYSREARKHPETLTELEQEVSVLPVNMDKAEEYLQDASLLRDRIAHSNDVLILSSAAECDYFVTYDKLLSKTLKSSSNHKPQVVTPEQLLSQLGSKV
jgi:predicted nucleic acid-binding protein